MAQKTHLSYLKHFKSYSLILGILLLAFILRFYNLEKIPPGFHRDEAAWGYEAYSLIKTGKDQYGRFLPIAFEVFGVWEYPVQFYLKIPFIALFGLNIASVRLSVVFISLLTIFLIYKLVEKWFNDKFTALIAATVAAFSSWHFFMSRAGYSQAFYGLLMLLLGTYFLLLRKGLKAKIFGGIALGLTTYSYPAYFFFSPLYFLIILALYRKEIGKDFHFKLGLLIAVLMLIISYVIFWKPNTLRIPGGAFYQDPGIRFSWADKPVGEILSVGGKYDILERILHHPRLGYHYKAATNYFDAFSPAFWLKTGKGFESNVEGFGNLLIYEPFLIVLGAIYLIWQKKKVGLFLILWIIASPSASMFTKEPASTRLLHMIVPLLIFEAIALKVIIDFFKKIPQKALLFLPVGFLIGAIFINVLYYDAYFRHMPINAARWWFVGFLDVVDLINSHPQKNVYWQARGDFAYIFILFKNKYEPSKFQKGAKRELTDYNINSVIEFDRYHFENDIDWTNLCQDQNAIYIADSQKIKNAQFPPDGSLAYQGAYTFDYFLTSKEKCQKLEKELKL